ncbi:MAG: hypothetical protein M3R02_16790 [Chloroflexota bacterium]|nr:hypothetical protein [Chloroflexota bacterium]
MGRPALPRRIPRNVSRPGGIAAAASPPLLWQNALSNAAATDSGVR